LTLKNTILKSIKLNLGMALTRLYYVVGGVTLFFLSLPISIIAVYQKKPYLTTPHPKIFFPLPLDILFNPMLHYIHSEKKKNRMGDRILRYFNLRVFTNQPIKKLNIYFKYLAHIYPFLAIFSH